MFAVIYRWCLKPGTESQFAAAWAERTRAIRNHDGGLGSRLHRADDGWLVAYAQWPSREAWGAFMAQSATPSPAAILMRSCIAASEPPVCLEVVEDLLAHVGSEAAEPSGRAQRPLTNATSSPG